jgi:hypothetical protein
LNATANVGVFVNYKVLFKVKAFSAIYQPKFLRVWNMVVEFGGKMRGTQPMALYISDLLVQRGTALIYMKNLRNSEQNKNFRKLFLGVKGPG